MWHVNDEHGPEGRRVRKFFATEVEAAAYAKSRQDVIREFGIRCRAFTPEEQRQIGFQLDRLKRHGWTLEGAVDLACRSDRPGPSVPLAQVATEFLADRESGGLRPRSLRKLRASIELFLAGRRERPMSGIRPAEIREFVTRNGWASATVKSYLGDVRTLFSFAVREGYLPQNTAERVTMPRMDEAAPGVLRPDQCRTLLSVARLAAPDLVPTLALCLFAGLRPEEARRLEWADIGAEFVEVKATKAKTRRRRLVPISAQLCAWLDVGGLLPVRGFVPKFNRVRQLAGLLEGWPHDALRHSFASYHLAQHKDENSLAAMMGNSPQMLFAHYRAVVTPKDSQAFFAILPGNCGPEALPADVATAARAARTSGGRRGQGAAVVTLSTLADLFRHGDRRAVPRQTLIRELTARGVRQSTAYDTLGKRSHLGAFLEEHEGQLSLSAKGVAAVRELGEIKAATPPEIRPAIETPADESAREQLPAGVI